MQIFDKNKNPVLTYENEGYGMTVTGFQNGIYSVVYGDTFYNGLPAYVYPKDVIVFNDISNLSNVNEM
jgi:hypothetical protein